MAIFNSYLYVYQRVKAIGENVKPGYNLRADCQSRIWRRSHGGDQVSRNTWSKMQKFEKTLGDLGAKAIAWVHGWVECHTLHEIRKKGKTIPDGQQHHRSAASRLIVKGVVPGQVKQRDPDMPQQEVIYVQVWLVRTQQGGQKESSQRSSQWSCDVPWQPGDL